MRIFNEEKTTELFEYDLNKGYLKNDKLFIAHHEEVKSQEGSFHYETKKAYSNGGKEVEKIWDSLPIEGKEAYDEYEEIQVYTPYTAEELSEKKEELYPYLVETYIREKYSLSAELAILRQRDSKPEEFNAYNDYAEVCKNQAKTEIKKIYGDIE